MHGLSRLVAGAKRNLDEPLLGERGRLVRFRRVLSAAAGIAAIAAAVAFDRVGFAAGLPNIELELLPAVLAKTRRGTDAPRGHAAPASWCGAIAREPATMAP
jgi:hypothetical protein